MSQDMEKPIRVNFATVEELQSIPHVGLKVACAIIALHESRGNLTLETLQTFLRAKFNAETLEMLDFSRNVSLPVFQLPLERLDFEGGEETELEERQRPISPTSTVFEDPFEMEPTTSVKTEVVEQRQPSIAERWEAFRHKFSPVPGMPVQKLTLPSDPSQIRQTPIDYKVLRPTKLAEELGHKSKKKEGKRSKSRHRGKGAKHKKRGHRDPSSSSTSPSPRSAKKGEKLGKLGKSKHHKKPRQKKRVESNSSSATSDEEYQKRGAKPKKKEKYSSSPSSSSDSSSSDTDSDDEIRAKHRSHHRKSKKKSSSDSSSSSTDSDDEFNIHAKHRSHHKKSKKRGGTALLRLLPKNLSYDGKTNWLAFKQKFTRYATACEWTSEECLNCLCWCLTDKAADFYAILMERNEHLTYRRLMSRLEKRFGVKELAETAQARFQQATQASGESLEDWADRVLTLATKAFKTLPEHYSSKQAVVRFCEGLLDREAGLRVGMDKPANIEQAINSVRWYQHLQQSVYGKSSKRDQRKQEESYVKAVQETRVQTDEQSSLRISSLEAAMAKLQKSFDAMSSKMTQQQKKPGGQTSSGTWYKRPGTLKQACYRCGEVGHFRRDCPNKQGRQESGQQNLNGRGPGPKADPRPKPK